MFKFNKKTGLVGFYQLLPLTFLYIISFTPVFGEESYLIEPIEGVEFGHFIGEIKSKNTSSLSSISDGEIVWQIELGQTVKKGERLFTLENPELSFKQAGLKSDLEGTESLLNYYKKKGENYQSLIKNKSITEDDFLNNEKEIKITQARFNRIKTELAEIDYRIDNLSVFAPFDGQVIHRNRNINEWVQRNEPLLQLQDHNEFYIHITVPFNIGAFLRAHLHDLRATIEGSEMAYGISSIIPPTGNDNSFVTFLLDINQMKLHGEEVHVFFSLPNTYLYRVPIAAIKQENQQQYLFSKNETTNSIHRYPIQIIKYDGEFAILAPRINLPDRIISNIASIQLLNFESER